MATVGRKLALSVGFAGMAMAGAGAFLRRARWFDYAGRRALVTGGARGLGLVIARQLVARGAKVAICSRTAEELEIAAADLRHRGGDVIAHPCDVTDIAQVEGLTAQIVERWGGIDLLFNVAGVIEVGPFDSMTTDDFHQSMDTHCWGVLNTTRAALPSMRKAGWGRIVNIASLGGKRAVPHMLPYAASKFALVGLSSGLRAELAPEGILVTTVCPGLMRTGSPRNATFKGQHRKEYAWFSIGDSLPLVSMSVEQAAAKILLACQRGDAELVTTPLGSLALKLQGLAPNLAAEVTTFMQRLLPAGGGIGVMSAKGHESESFASPSILTRLGDRAAERNNEMTSTDHNSSAN
jgi:NAD(P)-dependent dehydrogenase (short-subunit alcohol dehydrogenase family)